MGLFTNTNDFIYTSNSYNSPISNEIINDNGRVVSLLGPSIKGKSFIPQGFTSYNNFSKVCGSVKEHYKEYQGKIDSILTSYITLNSNAQLNYTRLLGINKSTFNNLPGFKTKPFSAKLIAKDITFFLDIVPYFNKAWSKPKTVPGTATAR